jgi:hypothetical protein
MWFSRSISWSAAILLLVGSSPAFAVKKKLGFDLGNASVPVRKIVRGGVPRDGIPSIDSPRFVPIDDVIYLKPDDKVISVERDGVVRAYPIRILNHHEIVNDSIGDHHFVVTYCPLCGTAMVFDREMDGKIFQFGVSGLLYQSDVLLYDRETESLWSQLGMEAISGSYVGRELEWLPSEVVTWESWNYDYPDGEVLSTDTGFSRPYLHNPYGEYENMRKTMFPVPHYRKELKSKEWVLGVLMDETQVAFQLSKLRPGKTVETIGGKTIEVEYNPETGFARAREKGTKEELISVQSYWFAWQAFYPETHLWTGK